MIVYRKQEEPTATAGCVSMLRRAGGAVRGSPPGAAHRRAVELLMLWGEFESAAADSLCGHMDGVNGTLETLRELALLAGLVFTSAWEQRRGGAKDGATRYIDEFMAGLERVSAMGLPPVIKTREPEGYAHYGLYPETYIESAKKFFCANRPKSAAVIGLRSIGASLSAVAAATLKLLGCDITAFTLRPRGHPFKRRVLLAPQLGHRLKTLDPDFFVIADEGPGLSGSSFSSAADALSELGVPDEKIIFLPSWAPDGEAFVSGRAKERWQRHKKYTADFEDIWIKSGELADGHDCKELLDISAGRWRGLVFEDEAGYPPAHPHHEKRKYLFKTKENGRSLLRFAGLGRYGERKYRRAVELAGAGFTQPVLGFADGFLETGFVEARPVAKDDVSQGLIDRMAGYAAFIMKNFEAKRNMGFDELAAMMRRNALLGLGGLWADRLDGVERFRSMHEDTRQWAVDGRMLPCEWLITPDGRFIKADAFDHCCDQFFPCSQDIAWDIAGAMAEFRLSPANRDYLAARYASLSGDARISERLPFYLTAYLAYRLGYCVFAADELEPSLDGVKFRDLAHRYAAQLKKEILRLCE